MRLLDRIRRVSRDELVWRTGAVARIHRDRLSLALRPMPWDRHRLADALASTTMDPSLRSAIDAGQWSAVHDALFARLRERRSRFMLDPARAEQLRAKILGRWPFAATDAATQADDICRGRYTILGYRDVSFAHDGRTVDWHYDPIHRARAPQRFWADVPYLDRSCGDHKVIWEINRQQHWLGLGRAYWLTQDSKYADTIVTQLYDWLAANPPLVGINWASMLELGFRSISWTYALHFLLAGSATSDAERRPWLVDMLLGLDRQLTHVEHNLSRYFSPNTHLTGEALALYVTGRSLPELAAADRWAACGRRILLDEIEAQILQDGGHAERALHYHRYTLDFYLCALLVAERTGDATAIGPFRDAVARLSRFARALADDDGRLATIGDDDGGMLWPFAGRRGYDVRDSLALAAVLLDDPALAPWDTPEETCWMLGALPVEAPTTVRARARGPESALFADSGYAVIRDSSRDHLILDVGTHGFLNGGHAHADALSLTLSLDGLPLLVDPGTASYTVNSALRDHFRCSASHNTVVVDGASSSEPAGPFHWRRRTDARSSAWRGNSRFAWAQGYHDGYAGLRHRRNVVHAAGAGWFVIDELLAPEPGLPARLAEDTAPVRHVDVNWHFHPEWVVTCAAKTLLRAVHGDGRTAWLAHDDGGLSLVRGDDDSPLGWCAPEYGRLVPMWSARISHSLSGPAVLVTWVGSGNGVDDVEQPTVERLQLGADPGHAIHAARVAIADRTETVLLCSGDSIGHEARGASVSDYHTDGRLLHLTARHGDVQSVAIVDGSHAVARHDGGLSVVCARRVDDLLVAIDDDVIDIATAVPLPMLKIQGAAAAQARLVRVNGRERPLVRTWQSDTVIIAERTDHAPPAQNTGASREGDRITEETTRCVA